MARGRIRRESLMGQGKRLPKSYRKWRRQQLAKIDTSSPEYQAWLARHQAMLDRLNKGRN